MSNEEKSIMGDYAIIKNHNAHRAADKEYISVLVEFDFNGEEFEKELFFTKHEYESLRIVECDFQPLMKRGHLYHCKSKKDNYFYLLAKRLDGVFVVYRLTARLFERSLNRAEKNPEDIRPRNFFRDMLD